MNFIAALLLIPSLFASTKAFDVRSEISLDGNLVARPHIVAPPGMPTMMNQSGGQRAPVSVEMIAWDNTTGDPKDGIFMKFTVKYFDKHNRPQVATPQIVALPGEQAEMAVGEKDRGETFKISVLAKRVE